MKPLFLAFSLITALMVTPAGAQQGPAGVPGAPALAAAIAPPAPAAQSKPRKPAAKNCNTARNPEQCKARLEARRQAREACKDKKGDERKQCIRDQLAPK